MFLNHPLLREQFLRKGRACTLRSLRRRREGVQSLVQGSRYRHRPLGRGSVALLREFPALSPRGLAPYVRRSGFPSAAAWIQAYIQFNKGRLALPAYLYEIRKL